MAGAAGFRSSLRARLAAAPSAMKAAIVGLPERLRAFWPTLRQRLDSLTVRVLAYSTIWALIGLLILGVVISSLYTAGAERNMQDLLRTQLYSLINSISVNPTDKSLQGDPPLNDLAFQQPGSGWYWEAIPLGDYKAEKRMSDNMVGVDVPSVSGAEVPFNPRFERYYATTDSAGNNVRVAEAEISVEEDTGDEVTDLSQSDSADSVYRSVRFRMIGNHNTVEQDVALFNRSLYFALALFGAGSLVLNALVILIGLRPLDGVRRSLADIRDGRAEKLDENLPLEIQPLAHEVNALIEGNRRVMERARMQVGNLAHSLKTPIAVLLNDADQMQAPHGDLVRSQAEIMRGQVQSYLNRARIAAQRDSILARTEAEPVLERLVRVMRKLNPDTTFDLSVPRGLRLAMEAQDVEETIGNLVENAARFARSRIAITAAPASKGVVGDDPARRGWASIIIDDDGPGLEPDQIKEAMKRGRRLDESKPGTGLGLSIVSEIVAEYKGVLQLSRAPGGGLRAELVLPAIGREN
ncbi:sensor histidine kinase [Rhizobium sp.]